MEGYQIDVCLLFDILLELYYSSLKLISSFLKFAILITKICFNECIYGLKLLNEYKYSAKGKVYNELGGLFHWTIRPGSMSIYMWSYSFELYLSMRESIGFEQRMFFEWARLESFHTAPETLRMWKIKLAKYGFYYTGSGNNCKCVFCGLVYGNWRYTDDPEDVHRRLSPNCPLVHDTDRMNTNNIPINATEGSQRQSAAISLARNHTHTAVFHHGHISRYQTREDMPGPNDRDDAIIAIRRQEQLLHRQLVGEMQQAKYPNYVQLHTRIGTFGEWPSNNQTPRDLAEAGFYYTGVDDCCRCFFCGGGLQNWESGDDPWAEHARWFPNCDFVRKYKGDENVNNIQQQAELNNPGNSSENDVSNSKTTNSVETSPLITGPNFRNELQNLIITIRRLAEAIRRLEEEFDAIQSVSTQHVAEMQQAKHPNYFELDIRMETFRSWSSNNQAPRNLAQAGLYYTGEGDCCRCFFCDGGLREWEPGDDPWAEHARWFPNCDFVRRCKGDEFVNSIQQLNDPGNSSENDVNSSKTTNSVETSPLITEVNDLLDGGLRNLEPGYDPCAEPARLFPNCDVNDPGNSSENDVNNSKTTDSVEPSPLIAEAPAENLRLSEGLKCLKCTTERICMTFIPCGHTITCEDCSKTIQRCFKCNMVVKKALKVFIS